MLTTMETESNIPPEAGFIECDIRDFTGLEKAFRQFRPEVVNHHAAQISVRDSVADPRFDADVNIGGSLNVLRLCAEHKTEKFIFSSTGGALYGEPEKLPADESVRALPPSPYGISKLSTEHYVRYHSKNHGFGHVILRYANVYGERQNPRGEAGVIGIFCENIISGKPCVIFGNGEQTRDYLHVSDVSRANLLAASLEEEGMKGNLTGSLEHSIQHKGDSCVLKQRPVTVKYREVTTLTDSWTFCLTVAKLFLRLPEKCIKER